MKLFKHQQWQALLLLVLLFLQYYYLIDNLPEGNLWGIASFNWYFIALLSPIFQLYVLLCWRSELYYKRVSKLFGENGFRYYKTGFVLLIVSRPVTITFLAISNANTFNINSALTYILSFILLTPFIYLIYSIKKYFDSDRVVGLDHFKPEELKSQPFVKGGIFKYVPNAMYLVGFFILYLPGLILQSELALLVALYNHIFIWGHYYSTELPDIKVIYEEQQ